MALSGSYPDTRRKIAPEERINAFKHVMYKWCHTSGQMYERASEHVFAEKELELSEER